MLWIAILVALLISAVAVAAVVWPLLKPGPPRVIVESDELTDLLYRKDATLNAIKELEFDYRVGKFSQEDYERFDQGLRRQAISTHAADREAHPRKRQLGREPGVRNRPSPQGGRTSSTEDTAHGPSSSQCPDVCADATTQVVQTPTADGSAPRFCTNCGHTLEPQHKFCANCGTPVEAQVAAMSE